MLTTTQTIYTSIFIYVIPLCVMIFHGIIIDAQKEVKRYNSRVYKSIFGKEPPSISFNLQPISQGANFTMSYAFK